MGKNSVLESERGKDNCWKIINCPLKLKHLFI